MGKGRGDEAPVEEEKKASKVEIFTEWMYYKVQ